MDQRVKIAAAAGVLLVGTVVALLFRRDPPPPALPVPGTSDQLILRRHAAAQAGRGRADVAGRGGCVASQSAPTGSQEPVAAGDDRHARRMPGNRPTWPGRIPMPACRAARGGGFPWGKCCRRPSLPEAAARSHTIVDGDTLAALAERYLGSPEAAGAIFAANRDVLSDPQILPIGVELKIPRARRPAAGRSPFGHDARGGCRSRRCDR